MENREKMNLIQNMTMIVRIMWLMELWSTMSWMSCLLCVMCIYKGITAYSTVEELVVVVAVQFSQYSSVKFSISRVSKSYYVAMKDRVIA